MMTYLRHYRKLPLCYAAVIIVSQHIFSSMNHPLVMVERFVCPGDPWSYVLYRISQGKQPLSEGPD